MLWFVAFCGLLYCLFLTALACLFFFKQKTAYEMRISDWSSDVCSSDLLAGERAGNRRILPRGEQGNGENDACRARPQHRAEQVIGLIDVGDIVAPGDVEGRGGEDQNRGVDEQGESECDARIERGETQGPTVPTGYGCHRPGLDGGGRRIETV